MQLSMLNKKILHITRNYITGQHKQLLYLTFTFVGLLHLYIHIKKISADVKSQNINLFIIIFQLSSLDKI